MTSILFVNNLWKESLAIMQLSAVLKQAGHYVDFYLDTGNYRKLREKVKKVKPDLLGFSIMTGQHAWALKIAAKIKNDFKNCMPLTIFGGPHPTFAPGIVEHPAVDIVCRGEGEGALLDLVNSIEEGKNFDNISNLWVKKGQKIIRNKLRPLIENLDSLPFCDRKIFYKYRYFRNDPNKELMISRGCPFSCSFCFNQGYRQLYGMANKGVRRKSVGYAIDEIKFLKSNYKKTGIINFRDDIFTIDKEWLFNFLEIYKKEIRLPFTCNVRVGVDSEEVFMRLAESGCARVDFGLESGSEEIRRSLLDKHISDEQFYEAARLLKKYKIPFLVNNIFFIPGESIEDTWKTIEMNQKMKAISSLPNIFQPYPGTAISDNLLEKGLIEKDYFNNINSTNAWTALKDKDQKYKVNIFLLFHLLVKFPSLTCIIKKIVRIPPNFIFVLIHKASIAIDYWMRKKISFVGFLASIPKNYKEK